MLEEKEISNIAGAVSRELAKLNADTTKEIEDKNKNDKTPSEVFKCPECDGDVAAGIMYCQHCGCELEWEE